LFIKVYGEKPQREAEKSAYNVILSIMLWCVFSLIFPHLL